MSKAIATIVGTIVCSRRVRPFVWNIPAPLEVGKLRLEDENCVPGFLCEVHAIAGAKEITEFGGWRNYVRTVSPGA